VGAFARLFFFPLALLPVHTYPHASHLRGTHARKHTHAYHTRALTERKRETACFYLGTTFPSKMLAPSTMPTALNRRTALGSLAALLATGPARAAAPPAPSREATPPEITIAAPSVLSSINARDEAMRFKCSGGMMDCDGDRREFAKKQYENFKKRAAAGGGK
jgi:hypothetical protein